MALNPRTRPPRPPLPHAPAEVEVAKLVTPPEAGAPVAAGACVAVKRLKPNVLECEDDVFSFVAEARLLLALRHPSIIQYIGIGCADASIPEAQWRTMYLVQEVGGGLRAGGVLQHCGGVPRPAAWRRGGARHQGGRPEGGSPGSCLGASSSARPVIACIPPPCPPPPPPAPPPLPQFAEHGTLKKVVLNQMITPGRKLYSLADAVRWGKQMAQGLAYLHGCSPMVIHRDLKTENVSICHATVTRVDRPREQQEAREAACCCCKRYCSLPLLVLMHLGRRAPCMAAGAAGQWPGRAHGCQAGRLWAAHAGQAARGGAARHRRHQVSQDPSGRRWWWRCMAELAALLAGSMCTLLAARAHVPLPAPACP